MEGEDNHESLESYPMKGGDGPYSYVQNSQYQRGALEAGKEMISKAIAKTYDIKNFQAPFRVADLGCSTGPNTFMAVQNIVDAIELKYQSENLSSKIPEFQVFVNDHSSNDFNMLFKSLPPNRKYFAAGVPGSFYGSLFPACYLHFIHCSYALHWLSKVPREVMDKTSPAWNKGRIHYINAPKEVVEAYATRFAKDIGSFLRSRASELVPGGLMALILPAIPDVLLPHHITTATELELLGSCLMDMAKLGVINEEVVDSFNLPIYYTSPKEFRELIERSGLFSIEEMRILDNPKKHAVMPHLRIRTRYFRAATEALIGKYFGDEIINELFDRFYKKAIDSPIYLNPANEKSIVFLVLLKHRHYK